MHKNKLAFTLIELLVVIAIIGVLSGLVVVLMSGAKDAGYDAKRKAHISTLRKAIIMYNVDHGGVYPIQSTQCTIGGGTTPCSTLASALVPTYLASLPTDPISGYYTYQTPADGSDFTIGATLFDSTIFSYTYSTGYSTGSGSLLGSSDNPGSSCLAIKNAGSSTDGVYWIDTDGIGSGNVAFQVYCDMITDGGGWTLVRNSLNDANNTSLSWPTSLNSKKFYVGSQMVSGITEYRIQIVGASTSSDNKTTNSSVLAALVSGSGYDDRNRTISWTNISGSTIAARVCNQNSPVVVSSTPYYATDDWLYTDSSASAPYCSRSNCSIIGAAWTRLSGWVR